MGYDHWSSKMKDKFKIAKRELAIKRNCLNSDQFYSQNDIKNKWIRIPESTNELKQYSLATYS